MKANDVSVFLTLMNAIGVEPTALSVVELDRYIDAFNSGGNTPARLEQLAAKPPFPRIVTLHAAFDNEDLLDIARQIGLDDGEAIRRFASKLTVALEAEVNFDGTVRLLKIVS